MKQNQTPVVLKSKFLQEWIKIEYQTMDNLLELNYLDMDKFAIWLEEKVHNEAMKEAQSQFSDVCEQFGFR